MTLRLEADVLLWARARAFFRRTSVNGLIRQFLEEYAAIPDAWREGRPPPWTPEGRIVEKMDPVGAGHRAAGRDPETDPLAEAIALLVSQEAPLSRQS